MNIDMSEFSDCRTALAKLKTSRIKAEANSYLATRLLMNAIIRPAKAYLRSIEHKWPISGRSGEGLSSEKKRVKDT